MNETFPASGGTTQRDPRRWDQGCENDPVRNNVIVPDLRRRIAKFAPLHCCDIGAGTGYVTRTLAQSHDLSGVSWTLFENDRQMLQFSREVVENEGLSTKIFVNEFDIRNPPEKYLDSFDFAFCCFSSLEFGMSRTIAQKMMGLLRSNGVLAVYLPDLLEEVIQEVTVSGVSSPLENYRRHSLEVKKRDLFTGNIEPFIAYRIERLIMDFLDEITVCTRIEFLNRGDDRHILVIEFAKYAP